MSARTPPPIHLTILRRGDTHIIDLDEVNSLIPRSETHVDGAFLQELVAEVMHVTTRGRIRGAVLTPASTPARNFNVLSNDLERIGGLIFSHLLTDVARKRLQAAPPCTLYLRLDEQLIHLPWELCHDGKDFLAAKFSVGRQVITGYPIPTPNAPRKLREGLRVLLIVDPTETLTEVIAEAEQLSMLLDEVPGVEVTLLGGKGARKVPLLAALQDHDIVHFAGHSHYDAETPSKSGWRLHEGILTAGELSKLTAPPLLVFSNSCQAGATSEWQGPRHYEGQAFGIGSAFLLAGVRNYIGTFWVVHDEESVLFATTFYQGIVSGMSLGDALLTARHEILKQRGWESLSWASYMLYGDPSYTLLSRERQQSQTRTLDEQEITEKALPSLSKDAIVTAPLSLRRPVGKIFLVAAVTLVALLAFFLRSNFLPQKSLAILNEPYERAFADLKAGHRERAVSAFQQLVKSPLNTVGLGYDGLAAIYFEQGALTQAQEAIQKSLAASGPSPISFVTQGDIAFALGDWEGAQTLYRQAAQTDTRRGWQRAEAYNAMGVVSASTGRSIEARRHFLDALHVDEASVEAYQNLGYLAWKEGKIYEAEQTLHKGLTLQPEDEQLQTLLVMIAAQNVSTARAPTNTKLLVRPFDIGGGYIRRLGAGEVFAWRLVQQLPEARYVAASNLGATFVTSAASHPQEPNTGALSEQEPQATFIVSGEIQIFSRRIIVHGQVTTVGPETLKRVSHISDREGENLATASRALAEKLLQVMNQEGSKQ